MYDMKNLAKLKILDANAPEGMKAFWAFDKAAMAAGAVARAIRATAADTRKSLIRTLLDSVLISHMPATLRRLTLAIALLLLAAAAAVRTQKSASPADLCAADLGENDPKFGRLHGPVAPRPFDGTAVAYRVHPAARPGAPEE